MKLGIQQRQRIVAQFLSDIRTEEDAIQRLRDSGVPIPEDLMEQHIKDVAHMASVVDKHTKAIEAIRESNRVRDRKRQLARSYVRTTSTEGTNEALEHQRAAGRARKQADRLREQIARYLDLSQTNPIYYDWRLRESRRKLAELKATWGEQVLGSDDD